MVVFFVIIWYYDLGDVFVSFLCANKKRINIIFIVSLLLDIVIGFLINIVSQEDFYIFDGHNIVVVAVLAVIICAYIILNIIIRASGHSKTKSRRLQKAFQDNGGYEYVVDEMKRCIRNHDYKAIKSLKKVVEIVEK